MKKTFLILMLFIALLLTACPSSEKTENPQGIYDQTTWDTSKWN